MRKTKTCDYCHQEIKYELVSTYVETTYLLKVPGFQAGEGWVEGVKPVARHKNTGYGRFAIICTECEKRSRVNELSEVR